MTSVSDWEEVEGTAWEEEEDTAPPRNRLTVAWVGGKDLKPADRKILPADAEVRGVVGGGPAGVWKGYTCSSANNFILFCLLYLFIECTFLLFCLILLFYLFRYR